MEQRSLKVLDADKNFFSKITSTIGKLLIPTKVGINGMLISMKRNNVLKSYEGFIKSTEMEDANRRNLIIKKYEDAYALYLESIDKYIMDSVYKKVRNGTASPFEQSALSNYYTVTHLKETEYIEYKHRKQKYLLELDYDTIETLNKPKLLKKYQEFYISKMDALYKGLLKNYSIQLADYINAKYQNTTDIYDKIFNTLDEYITNILPLKMQEDTTDTYKDIVEEYDKFEKFSAGKLDEKDYIEKNMILLGISRQLFTHSLPLVAAEQCYVELLRQARELIVKSSTDHKKERAYHMLITLIEDYNVKLLSTKIYWDKPADKKEYKEFWDTYKKIAQKKETDYISYTTQKQILFLKNDIKQLEQNETKQQAILKYYREKLVELGVMRELKNSCKTQNHFIKKKKKTAIGA